MVSFVLSVGLFLTECWGVGGVDMGCQNTIVQAQLTLPLVTITPLEKVDQDECDSTLRDGEKGRRSILSSASSDTLFLHFYEKLRDAEFDATPYSLQRWLKEHTDFSGIKLHPYAHLLVCLAGKYSMAAYSLLDYEEKSPYKYSEISVTPWLRELRQSIDADGLFLTPFYWKTSEGDFYPSGIIVADFFSRRLFVAFHGSENKGDMNACFDFIPKQAPFELEGAVHRGILKRYMALRSRLFQVCQSVWALFDGEDWGREGDPCELIVTGHSMGGALATIAAYDLQKAYPCSLVTLISFASPRVVNKKAQKHIESTLRAGSFRIWRKGDFLTALPFGCLSFKHVGVSVPLKKKMGCFLPFSGKSHSLPDICVECFNQDLTVELRKKKGTLLDLCCFTRKGDEADLIN